MTTNPLRDKIAALPRYKRVMGDPGYRDMMMVRPEGNWLSRDAVLAILDAHPEQPAPDAVAEAVNKALIHVRNVVAERRNQLPPGQTFAALNDAIDDIEKVRFSRSWQKETQG